MIDQVTRCLLEEASVNPGSLSAYTVSAAATDALNSMNEMGVTILRQEGLIRELEAERERLKDILGAISVALNGP